MHRYSLGWRVLIVSWAIVLNVFAQSGSGPTRILSTVPAQGELGVRLDAPFVIAFSAPVQASTVTGLSITLFANQTIPVRGQFQLSANRKVVIGTIASTANLDANVEMILTVFGGQILDDAGQPIDADGDGLPGGDLILSYQTGVPLVHPLQTGDATILGRVFDASGAPLSGASLDAVYYPAVEGEPPLSAPFGISDAAGNVTYRTVPFVGTEHFLVRIRKADHSEILRQVMVLAGTCISIGDVALQPLTVPTPVTAAQGGLLIEPTGQASLSIPPGALQQSSSIGLTVLSSSELLREQLPQLVAPDGTFVDVAGIFGEQTTSPVTMRFPNIHNLPVGTRVPFGKVDHNTLQWSDLRALYSGPLPIPDSYLGEVKTDASGTFIEVQFDNFCSICTGYCLPFPTPVCTPADPSDPSGRNSDGPGENCGNSTIGYREGHLRETVSLPTFREFNGEAGLALGYASYAANPSITLSASVNYNSTRPVERTTFKFQIEGRMITATYAASANNQRPEGTWIWDGMNGLGQRVPTGSYLYSTSATSQNANTQVSIPSNFGGATAQGFAQTYPGLTPLPSNEVADRAIVINLEDSPYGAGWSLMGEERLYFDPDGCIVLIEGNANWKRYDPDPQSGNAWISPPGDSSALVRSVVDGSYQRLFQDGSVTTFSPGGRILTSADRYGRTTKFTYSGDLLTRVETPTGFFWSLGYIGSKLRQITDSAGRITLFTVDAQGNLTSITDATQSDRNFTYDQNHLLIEQQGGRGERSTYTYTNGRVTEAQVYDVNFGPLLRTRSFAPSVLNGEVGLALASGMGTLANPIPLTIGRVDVTVDGRGGVSEHESDRMGRTLRTTDALGRNTLYTYNSDGLLASLIRPDNSSTNYVYNARFQVIQTQERMPTGTLYSTSVSEYNGPFFELSRVVDAEGKETLFTHDSQGNVLTITDHNGGTTTFAYGDQAFPDQCTGKTGPSGEQLATSYDSHGNPATIADYPDPIMMPSGRVYQFVGDDAGRVAAIINPLGSTKAYTYDAFNRISSVTDALSFATMFSYAHAGCLCSTANVTRVTFANGTDIRFVYDGLNRLTQRTDQLGNVSTFTYDAEGNPLSSTNRNGELIVYTYDSVGQILTKELPGAVQTTYSYDLVGNLVSAIDPFCSLTFQYDFLSRLTQTTSEMPVQLSSGQTISLQETLSSTYDRVGNRLSVQNASGTFHNAYSYDDLHRIQSLSLPNSAGATWSFAYDASGRRTSLTPPAGGAATTYSYDVGGRLNQISHATIPPLTLDYPAYDPVGNLAAQVTSLGPVSLLATYQYDALSQLTSSSFSLPFGDSTQNQSYTYDAANRLLTDGQYSYSYDAEGRLLSKARIGTSLTERFTWDAEGLLRGYEETRLNQGVSEVLVTALYTYDPLGRRIQKDVNGLATRFLFDNEDVIMELDGMNRVEKATVHGPGQDEPLAEFDPVESVLRFLHSDRLSSTIASSGQAGQVTELEIREEFGTALLTGPPGASFALGFTGRARDLESGLNHHRSRYLDSATGRFISEDPAGVFSSFNGYSYVLGNPTNLNDPSGEWAWIAASAGICAATNLAASYVASGGTLSLREGVAAATSGAVSGALGALAGPAGGTLARAFGRPAASALARAAGVGFAGLAGAAAQQVSNAICPGKQRSLGPNTFTGALGEGAAQGLGRFFPVRGLSTLKQASYFAPRKFASLVATPNARRLLGAFGLSCVVGSMSAFF